MSDMTWAGSGATWLVLLLYVKFRLLGGACATLFLHKFCLVPAASTLHRLNDLQTSLLQFGMVMRYALPMHQHTLNDSVKSMPK